MSDIRDESDDLVTRLRAWRDFEYVEGEVPHDLITRAIDEIERLRSLIREHNAECEELCAERSECEAYRGRGLSCPDCPRDWTIDEAGEGQR